MRKILLALALFFCLSVAFAAVKERTDNQTYTIRGSSPAELREQMEQKGPGRFYAYTRWRVDYRYDYLRQKDSCALDDIQVDLKITRTLPEFENYSTADPDLRKKWDLFIANLRQHEDGHARNGVEAAQEVESMLEKQAAMGDCEQLNEAAKSKANRIIQQYSQRDKDYDAQTQYGIKQGAVL